MPRMWSQPKYVVTKPSTWLASRPKRVGATTASATSVSVTAAGTAPPQGDAPRGPHPTRTASIDREPPSKPSAGKLSGSPASCRASTYSKGRKCSGVGMLRRASSPRAR